MFYRKRREWRNMKRKGEKKPQPCGCGLKCRRIGGID
jgi:hypothetical protein